MIDATGRPRSLLLLGGTSDIALAVAEAYAARTPGLRVTLAARPSARRDQASHRLEAAGCTVRPVDLEARSAESHEAAVRAAAEGGDVDVAVVAYGLLGDNERSWTDVAAGVELAEVNYVGPVAAGIALGALVRQQGHGVVVALSSVAGERPRRSNFVYGSTKAGFDAFYTGLGEALREHGGHVLVVRPGFVRSKMTEGLDPAPLATDPQSVAAAVLGAVDARKEQVWVPGTMRPVMSVLRHLPRPVFRRLPI
ncbi:decaprenylphospho-beta-D-erythro-pentofuranosid-2-ulose 2-reductase [uncultured Nocardioides sp.]|uniref:decaprenylphospho-beta-D-erythro-pentofuranosid- 2-ulose 2-reductase n=1 Tax=uncultured Nocardioides sp. TaxID=198441 RepID=UPI0025E06EE7|nr:decaprenylphospho-beta-D-erythro-pentofuranosid-2-ulose 2-reductase [uncultured Nocardioides sp.]